MERFRVAGIWMLVLAVVFSLAGCSEGKSVRLAVAGPMTGDYADGGKAIYSGVQLAVDEWNAKGGVMGKTIELVQMDDQGDATTAFQVAERVADEDITVVIGHYNSRCSLAARDVYLKEHVMMITPSSTTPELTESEYKTVFRVCGRDDKQGDVAAEYASKAFPEAKVAVLHDGNPYGKELATAFLNNYTFLTKKESVYYGELFTNGSNLENVLKELETLEADLIFYGGAYPQGGPFVKALRDYGSEAVFMSGDGNWEPRFIEGAGAENAEGALITFVPDPNAIPKAKPILEQYREKYGDPGPYSLLAYEAANVVLRGIDKAQSTVDTDIAAAIHGSSFDTVFGSMRFNEKGDNNTAPYMVWVVKDGQFVPAPVPEQEPSGEEEGV